MGYQEPLYQIHGKLAPRYVGPYKNIEQSGRVAYKLQLPPEMQAIFNVFHVFNLKSAFAYLMKPLNPPILSSNQI